MDEWDDDYKDFYEKIKEFFKDNPKIFDLDFLIFTGPDPNFDKKNKKPKSLKIHYHFEPGMKAPEVKIDGNMDKKELNDYLKHLRFNFPFNPEFKPRKKFKSRGVLDANQLSFEPITINGEDKEVQEPQLEICKASDCLKLVFEAPGIEKNDIILSISDDGKILNFSAEGPHRRYFKHVHLPEICTLKEYDIYVNNGLVILTVKKKIKG
ncbi:MAG: Hsp20/alpha crystallin family protein [Promethearchaeota archaeon]